VFFAVAAASIWLGMRLQTERYMTPETGIGYALGIIGGSLMLLLLLYPARKRTRWLSFIGSVKLWFQAHVYLGILGPILVLYHSNFHLGATNSNVALGCMLLVSGSGIVGRYFYTQIHHELYGRQMSLSEMKENAARLQLVNTAIPFLPELAARLEAEEKQLLAESSWLPFTLRPVASRLRAIRARWRLHGYIRRAIKAAVIANPVLKRQKKRLGRTARDFVHKRLAAIRRVAEFEAYERLFSFWHLLHVPLFFMLLVAGIVHVISVHVY
jgi:hypothetical protein